MKTITLAPDWCFIGLDQFEHWRFPADLAPYVEKVVACYAFNRSLHTHCCEITPSYWLEFIAHEARVKDGTPNAIRDRICELVMSEPGDGQYMHVATVNRMAERAPKFFHRFTDELDEDDRPADPGELPDAVHEYWNRNPKF